MDMNETVNSDSLSLTSIVSLSLVAGDDLSEAGCLKNLLRQCSSFLKVNRHCHYQEQTSLRDVKEKCGVKGVGQMNQSGMVKMRPIPKDIKRMNCHSLTLNQSKFKSKTSASNLLQNRLKFIKRRLLSKISLNDLRRGCSCSLRELKCLGKMENSYVEVNCGEELSWQERIKDRMTTTNMLNQLLKKGLETSYFKTSNSPKRLLFGGVNSTRILFHHDIVGNHTVVPWKLVCSNSECDPEYQINAAFLICRSGTNYKLPLP